MRTMNASTAAITITALAISASVTFAQGPVYSVNIVGFQKTGTSSQNLEIAANPFNRATNDVNAVLEGQMTTGDRVHVFEPSIGAYFTFERASDGTWRDGGDNLATNIIDTPIGFWVENKQSTNQTLVMVGDVVDDAQLSVQINSGLQIISYPYSTSKALNDSGLTNGFVGNRVHFFDSGVGAFVTYELAADKVWKDGGDVPATLEMQPNVGFWYENGDVSSFSWTEDKPYTNP